VNGPHREAEGDEGAAAGGIGPAVATASIVYDASLANKCSALSGNLAAKIAAMVA